MPDPLGDLAFTWPFYAAAALGYLLGSVPSGLLLTQVAGLGDIRTIGSGNIGATNVLRTGNGLALATLLFDAGKGAAAVLLAGLYGEDMAIMAAYGAVLGLFSCGCGSKAARRWLPVSVSCSPSIRCWAVYAVWSGWSWRCYSRYSSLAALVALAAAPSSPIFCTPIWRPHRPD